VTDTPRLPFTVRWFRHPGAENLTRTPCRSCVEFPEPLLSVLLRGVDRSGDLFPSEPLLAGAVDDALEPVLGVVDVGLSFPDGGLHGEQVLPHGATLPRQLGIDNPTDVGASPVTVEEVRAAIAKLLAGADTVAEQAQIVNDVREAIHELSPFAAHPVDFVKWVPADTVAANDYNPNSVAPPEMELLRLSIAADGYTQPIVTNLEDETRVVIDGFHRNRVGRECDEVAATLHGHLPVVQIRSEAQDRSDRMASTIRHNRARGKHSVVKMTDIVLELKRRNWSDSKISKQLGMDPDEVLRLSQIGGLADSFADRSFSEAWEIDELEGDDDGTVA
jgi:hypothetical protein